MTLRWILCVCFALVIVDSSVLPSSSSSSNIELDETLHRLQTQLDQLKRSREQDRLEIERLKLDRVRVRVQSTPTVRGGDESDYSETDSERRRSTLTVLSVQLSDLRSQLTALVASKQKDSDLTGEVGELRGEADSLRGELRRLRGDLEREKERRERDGRALSQVTNSQATVRWLRRAVDGLKSELAELAAVQNVSAALRQKQEWESGSQLIRADLGSVRAEIEGLRAGQGKTAMTVDQLRTDTADLRLRQRQDSAHVQLLNQEMLRLRDDISAARLLLNNAGSETDKIGSSRNSESRSSERTEFSNHLDHSLDGFVMDEIEDKPLQHRTRHKHGQWKHQMESNLKRLVRRQSTLEQDQLDLRRNQSSLSAVAEHSRTRAEKLDAETTSAVRDASSLRQALLDLGRRVTILEEGSTRASETLRNVTGAAAGMGKLHESTVQLLEALEGLETEFGRSTGQLQREVSKLEFDLSQTSATCTIVREDEAAHFEAIKSARQDVAQIKASADADHIRLIALQTTLLNQSLVHCLRDDREEVRERRLLELEDRLDVLAPRDGPRNESRRLSLGARLALLSTEVEKLFGQLPSDCSMNDIPIIADYQSGRYLIHPPGSPTAVHTFCDMDAADGPWTMIQRHSSNEEDFDRSWSEYSRGFGATRDNYWLGLDSLHRLTSNQNYTLRVDLWFVSGEFRYAEYSHFAVAPEADRYRLTVGGYRGNATDALHHHDGMAFSTRDRDWDSTTANCAQLYRGGWWYDKCQFANPNGRYEDGFSWYDADTHSWLQLIRVQMKIKLTRRSS